MNIDIAWITAQTEGLGMQMEPIETLEIAKVVVEKRPANLLIFGIGNDSHFWTELNKGGRTIFIEDDEEWFTTVKDKHPDIEAYLVNYNTKSTEWQALLDTPELLELNIPPFIYEIPWDIIVVDAPRELASSAPGRMKSIYMASKLIKNGGDVFVHDAEREIESAYCARYLNKENLVLSVSGCAKLDHYRVG